MIYTKKKKKLKLKFQWFLLLFILLVGGFFVYMFLNQDKEEVVIEEPIVEVKELTQVEKLILGARKDALAMPAYISAYYSGGYPPDNEGTCTDLVWRAFKEAGILLKDLVDEDIKNNRSNYDHIKYRDPNIDFRRVQNLKIYLDNNAISLTTDINKIDKWQGGDIIVFKKHIGIVSDNRNKKGITFIIHHANPYQRYYEEDILEYRDDIVGHYRIS